MNPKRTEPEGGNAGRRQNLVMHAVARSPLCVERCFRPPDRLSVLEKKYIECCCYVFTNKCLLFCGMLQSFSGFISVGSGTDQDFKGVCQRGIDWDKRTDVGSPRAF